MFQIHTAQSGGFYWTLQDQGNNETLCHSETYTTKVAAQNGIKAAISAASGGKIQDLS